MISSNKIDAILRFYYKLINYYNLPSSISGGRPPTNTFREKRSHVSDPWELGDDLAGEPRGNVVPSTNPASSVM